MEKSCSLEEMFHFIHRGPVSCVWDLVCATRTYSATRVRGSACRRFESSSRIVLIHHPDGTGALRVQRGGPEDQIGQIHVT